MSIAAPSSSGSNQGAMQATAITTIPLPPNLSVDTGDAGQSWKKWKRVFDSYSVLSNLQSKTKEGPNGNIHYVPRTRSY